MNKMDQIFGGIDKLSNEKTKFSLSPNQHKKEIKPPSDNFESIILKSSINSQLAETIKKKPILEEVEDQFVLCLKRKRTDEPMSEILLETPKKKKQNLIDSFDSIEITDYISKFSYIDSSKTPKDEKIIKKIKETDRTNFKKVSADLEKNKKQVFEKSKQSRLIKLDQFRDEKLNFIHVQKSEDYKKDLEPFKEMVKEYNDLIPEQEDEVYEYDFYLINGQVEKTNLNPLQIMKFDEDLVYENEYENDDENMSIDSNDEDHPNNEYPDDEKENEDESPEEGDVSTEEDKDFYHEEEFEKDDQNE